jgi:hypothetical protein
MGAISKAMSKFTASGSHPPMTGTTSPVVLLGLIGTIVTDEGPCGPGIFRIWVSVPQQSAAGQIRHSIQPGKEKLDDFDCENSRILPENARTWHDSDRSDGEHHWPPSRCWPRPPLKPFKLSVPMNSISRFLDVLTVARDGTSNGPSFDHFEFPHSILTHPITTKFDR